ncbi:6-phosphofructokinase [Crocinitomix catalasitica]|uniref:6-phosphofructokinase n=1 Tax=Crocinitomix catalasitica TaxID=184607 RepID=UPI000483B7A8|nr:6-phosphofructokinase [Crocinitomix catalasitica]
MIKVQNIAVLTSGGDAPGMNACIRSVVRAAIYHGIGAFGVHDGFNGLINNNIVPLLYDDVSNILQRGGTILGTARSKDFRAKEFREVAHQNLKDRNIDALIVIGGDGSFKGMKTFSEEFDFPVIGIPATIDNDINGTDYAIGFDTALNNIIDAVDKIRDTASSHHRVFLVEVMGNNSGVLALHAAAASGAEEVFIPERQEDLLEFKGKIARAVNAKKSSIIIVSEGDGMGGAKEIYAYLKAEGLDTNIRVSILGHIQRGGSPSYLDRLYSALFGEEAIVCLLKGKRNLMTSLVDGKVTSVNITESFTRKTDLNMDYLKLIRKLSIY